MDWETFYQRTPGIIPPNNSPASFVIRYLIEGLKVTTHILIQHKEIAKSNPERFHFFLTKKCTKTQGFSSKLTRQAVKCVSSIQNWQKMQDDFNEVILVPFLFFSFDQISHVVLVFQLLTLTCKYLRGEFPELYLFDTLARVIIKSDQSSQ